MKSSSRFPPPMDWAIGGGTSFLLLASSQVRRFGIGFKRPMSKTEFGSDSIGVGSGCGFDGALGSRRFGETIGYFDPSNAPQGCSVQPAAEQGWGLTADAKETDPIHTRRRAWWTRQQPPIAVPANKRTRSASEQLENL